MVAKREQRIQAARVMRYESTPAEAALWSELRNRKLIELRFYRQRPIGPLIADFYCAAARLVVEVDGGIHDYQTEDDEMRTSYLIDSGYKVIRFRNDLVLSEIDRVLSKIKEVALERIADLNPDLTPQPPPLETGEGEEDIAL